MREQIFESNSLHINRKNTETTIENTYGAIDIYSDEQKLFIDLRRKSESIEPTFENSRKKIESNHNYSKKLSHGTIVVDSENKEESAVNYEGNLLSNDEKIMKNLYNLKNKIYNKTLFELLPENELVFNKIHQEIKNTQEEEKKKIRYNVNFNLHNISRQILDDDTEVEENV